MADDARGKGDPGGRSSEEAALSARLRRLGDRLDRQETSREVRRDAEARQGSDPSGLARAMRLSAELVGGVVVGAGLGLGLDYLAGTTPWGFIVMVLLGFAGGVLTVMRSAGVIPDRKL